MPVFNAGIVAPTQVAGVIPNQVFGIAINWFAPRTPLLARLGKVPDGNAIFQMVGHSFRPRLVAIGATGFVNATDTTTTLTDVTDPSSLLAGDVFLTPVGEYVEVVSDPAIGGTTVAFRRGVGGSTKAIQAASVNLTLVGNTRTGAEDFPQSVTSTLTAKTQYMQTIQHPYSVGGSVQTNEAFPTSPGASTPLDQYRMDAMQNWMDDAEISSYLGKAEAAASSGTTGRAKMGGIRNIITTNFQSGNAITDYNGYKAIDFQRDLLTRPRKKGGSPDIVVVASNWMDAFATWSQPLQRIMEGETKYGRAINTYTAPFLGDAIIVESSLLPDFTAFSLTSQEARYRVKRPLVDEPLAKTGDVHKGQMIGELAVELDNEAHHAWVEGITAFAA